jgi:AbrB family looped-hinge helix DNA binding protein
MMSRTTGVVTRKGQVTIPSEARKALGINEGDQVSFVWEDKILKVERLQSWVDRTKGIFKHAARGLTREQEKDAFEQAVADEVAESLERSR